MIQGTGSDVGKSIIVAGLCRAASNRGMDVAPFKPQNMSNNAAACPGGGEIGRAQALQARAARLEPHVDQNPVLLKPETDRVAQVVVHGRVQRSMEAAAYIGGRHSLLPQVLESFCRLTDQHDLVIVEGAGSPAETNLRERDIANMGFAIAADVPVCLVGDIERGGVIASVVGTKTVISPEDANLINGFLINKFRGDPSLFDEGVKTIEAMTGWPCYGVIPWIKATARLPAEDAVSAVKSSASGSQAIRIVAPMLSRMANFDDADPLRLEPQVDFEFIPPGQPLPRDADLIILFGSKSTLGDLKFLRAQGWDHDILTHARHGGRVLGICGGYQMLGERIRDEFGSDGEAGETQGLGLLNVETTMGTAKTVTPVQGTCAVSGEPVSGYEIHVGQTDGPDCNRPVLNLDSGPEGAISQNGKVTGTYVHGCFSSDTFRQRFLSQLGGGTSELYYEGTVDAALDELAGELEAALDLDQLFSSARQPKFD